jgi:hypothetical protein
MRPALSITTPRKLMRYQPVIQCILLAVVSGCGGSSSVEPLYVSRVQLMQTDRPGGVYYNWIGAWSGATAGVEGRRFGYLLPYDEPNTPQVEQQFYREDRDQPPASILSVGPGNGGVIPEQVLTVTHDSGVLAVYLPRLDPEDCVRTRLYVAVDGSTYHSRSDHDYTYSPARANIFDGRCFGGPVVGPDMSPEQAMVPRHLARAAP